LWLPFLIALPQSKSAGLCLGSGFREEDAEVSAWRLLTIVNKFAELQTYRVTCPAFTLLMMVSQHHEASVKQDHLIIKGLHNTKCHQGIWLALTCTLCCLCLAVNDS